MHTANTPLEKDWTGRRAGKVTILHKDRHVRVQVVRPGEEHTPKLRWRARCDCGHEWYIPHHQVTQGSPKACKQCQPLVRAPKQKLGPKGKHYKRTHPSYGSWYSMWRRCTHTNHTNYHNYGGRGIKVCERWRSFDLFVEDMGIRPDAHTIDRIDNNQDYTPANCRWATAKQQRANQRK